MAPDPKPRRHREHRRGVEPAGLRRWRLSHKHKADPRPRHRRWKAAFTGPRSGRYWQGPHKRRYDPAPRRFARLRSYGRRARGYGGKLESSINKYGSPLGALLAALWGIVPSYQAYSNAYGKSAPENYWKTIIGGTIKDKDGNDLPEPRIAEIAHLFKTDDKYGLNTVPYLQFKLLGIAPDGTTPGSAWVAPFWFGIVATLAAPIARIFTNKGQRFLRPLHKIGIGALAMSTVGALALPGCPDPQGHDPVYGANKTPTPAPQPILQNQFVGQNEGAY